MRTMVITALLVAAPVAVIAGAAEELLDVATALAAVAKLQICDVEIAYSNQDPSMSSLAGGVLKGLGEGDAVKSFYAVGIEAALNGTNIDSHTKIPRCLMYLTLVSDVALLESYLRSRESTGLFHKQRWHVFATGNPAVIDAIYANVEFQYHAQTVSFLFNRTTCLLRGQTSSKSCRMFGYAFDTFGTFKPQVFLMVSKTPTLSALSADDVFPDLLSDMKGYNFTVAALSWFPFVWKRNGRHEGTEMQMLEYLASQLNFTYNIVEPPDGAWGSADANGTWSGLIGHALYGRSNWSMSGIVALTEREAVIDYTHHFFLDYIDWVAPLPQTNPKWPAIFKPFTIPTWAMTVVVAVVSGPVIAFLVRFSPWHDRLNSLHGLPRSVLYVFCMLFGNSNVDTDRLPQNPAPKCFLVAWWIFCFVMSVAYTGNLVAFMTEPGMQDPLDTPARVLKSGIPIGAYNYQGSTTASFEATTNPEYQKMWERKHWITSFSDSYEKAIRGEMIFMDYRYGLEAAATSVYLDALGRRKLHMARFDTFRFGYGWAVQPRSMFLARFNQHIKEMDMTGHMAYWLKKEQDTKKRDVRAAMSDEERFYQFGSEPPIEALIVDDLQGPIYIYVLGMALAAAAFASETAFGAKNRRL